MGKLASTIDKARDVLDAVYGDNDPAPQTVTVSGGMDEKTLWIIGGVAAAAVVLLLVVILATRR